MSIYFLLMKKCSQPSLVSCIKRLFNCSLRPSWPCFEACFCSFASSPRLRACHDRPASGLCWAALQAEKGANRPECNSDTGTASDIMRSSTFNMFAYQISTHLKFLADFWNLYWLPAIGFKTKWLISVTSFLPHSSDSIDSITASRSKRISLQLLASSIERIF